MICPNCLVSVPSGEWTSIKIISDNLYNYSIDHFNCAECSQISLKLMCNLISTFKLEHYSSFGLSKSDMHEMPCAPEEFLIPKTIPRPPIPKGIEKIYVKDYDEAVKLLPISPMASAAFSRRLLQHYIEKKHKIKKPNLKQEIEELGKLNRYPLNLIELFDHIRHYGTFAAHAKTDQISGEIIDIDPGEADSLLDIIEEMFDYDYERERRIKERGKKLQDKLQRSKPNKKKKT